MQTTDIRRAAAALGLGAAVPALATVQMIAP
jgi:hypothetical protein